MLPKCEIVRERERSYKGATNTTQRGEQLNGRKRANKIDVSTKRDTGWMCGTVMI